MIAQLLPLLLRVDAAPAPHVPSNSTPFYVLDPNNFARYLPGDMLAWARDMVPFIDFPADEDVVKAYYYRWRSYREHIRWTGDDSVGYVVTEFLPNVGWAGKFNTIPAAAGHHIMEGRWLFDQRIVDDYLRFWFKDGLGHISSYTNWILSAAWQRSLITGNSTALDDVFDSAVATFRSNYLPKYLSNSTANAKKWPGGRRCLRQIDGRDAMEVSISGSGCRPTIASVLYGEAAVLARLAPNATIRSEFEAWREFCRDVVLDQLWNPDIQSFAVIPPSAPAEPLAPHGDGTCDLGAVRTPNRTVNVRELLGFMPWYFARSPASTDGPEPLIPYNRAHSFSGMFRSLFNDSIYAAPWGLRSAELQSSCYNYSWQHGDCWNGPSWPYETARVLTSMASLLNEYSENAPEAVAASGMGVSEYTALLTQYARQHTRTSAINDTANPLGSGHVFENLHPDLGYWNNRDQMYWRGADNKNMGDDYNHSTFNDLVLSGLLGIRPGDGAAAWLVVNPLLDPEKVKAFAVDHVLYRSRIVSVVYDSDGTRYGKGKGLQVLVDGKVVASRADLGKLVVKSAP